MNIKRLLRFLCVLFGAKLGAFGTLVLALIILIALGYLFYRYAMAVGEYEDMPYDKHRNGGR